MSNLNKVLSLCACCLCLTASNAALADYVGLVHVTKADDDTVDLCNNANGENVSEPLDVCNVLAQFDNPVDRLLSVGHGDITASNGLYYQNQFNPVVIAPTCFFVGLFPDLICDSFVTIGYKCGPAPDGTDKTAPDGDFDADEFANNGHVVGGWFNGEPPNGQGDADTWPDLQVLFLQLSVPTGASITGTISVFAKIGEDIIEFPNQAIDCFAGGPECQNPEDCDDGDACTDDDCVGKVCVHTSVDCSGEGDECNTASCDPNGADGNCDIMTPEPDGTACGDPSDTDCDDPDTCDGAGACQDNPEPSGTSCPDDGDDCTDDVCDGSGTCTHPNEPDGTSCDDGQACTDGDECTSGSCGGTDVDCSGDGDQCNSASCDPNGADGNCDIMTPLPDGTPCDDSDACTDPDECTSGSCGGMDVDCDDGEFCNGEETCDPANGCQPGAPPDCSDDNACTEDNCVDGACANPKMDCPDDGNDCTDTVCHPDTGCGHVNNDADCDDEDACTINDVCSGGSCIPGEPLCDPDEVCVEGECFPVGCQEGDPCDDDDACTEDTTCDADGICGGGTPIDCPEDGNVCTDAACDPAVGCIQVNNTDGCDDGDACTEFGACSDGICVGGDEIECPEDGNPCTEAVCDSEAGCGQAPVDGDCDDEDACTLDDSCSGGECVGEPIDCPGGTICVDGECVEVGELEVPLDIKPRVCPNIVMRDTNAAVWAALLGSDDFDIHQVRMAGLLLSRADGVGGSLAPKNLKFKDEGTPFEGELCDCHAAGRDQITDLRMKFKTDAMVQVFHLNDEPSGSTIELIVTGQLNDGTMIFGRDCILLAR